MIRLLTCTVLATLSLSLTLAAQEYRAFWADAFRPGFKSAAEVDKLLEDLATAKCNAIFLETRLDGYSFFLKSLEPPSQDTMYSRGFDALEYTIQKAHERGIEVHAWFPVYPLWRSARAPLDPSHIWHKHGPNAEGADMWMTVSSTGAKSTSIDPGHPAAAEYLADVIVEPVKHYALDGIHLDYVRYPEDASYGYNPVALERFRRIYKRDDAPEARDVEFNEFRRRQVTDLVRQVYLRATAIRPQVKVSAAVITWGNGPLNDAAYRTLDAYSRVYQDWRGWMEEGIVDLAMPMSYFREQQNAAFLNRWMDYYKDRQYGRGLLVGLGNYLNSIPDTLAQVTRALAPSAGGGNKAMGFALYSYASTNVLDAMGLPTVRNEEFYRVLGETLGPTPGTPELAWKANPETGHLMGRLHVSGYDGWMLRDDVDVFIESDTGGDFGKRTRTDATGFFGAVELVPDRYRIRLEKGGVEIYRSTAQDLAAGATIEFTADIDAQAFGGRLP